jgi:hypothetical protein
MKYSGSKNEHPNNKSQAKAWLLSAPFLNTDAERNKRKKLDLIPQDRSHTAKKRKGRGRGGRAQKTVRCGGIGKERRGGEASI